MNNMAICNYIVGVLGAVIGGLIMQAAAEFPLEFTVNGPGAGFWPFALGCVMMATAIFLLIYTFINKIALSEERVVLTTPANKRVYLMMGIVVVFCVLIIAVMRLMDYHNKKVIALTTVLTLLFIYLVFGMLLNTNMPDSIFLE